MLSTTQVTQHASPKVVTPQKTANPIEAPETGDASFIDQLLGLQGTTSPETEITTLEGETSPQGPVDPTNLVNEKALAGKTGKKENPAEDAEAAMLTLPTGVNPLPLKAPVVKGQPELPTISADKKTIGQPTPQLPTPTPDTNREVLPNGAAISATPMTKTEPTKSAPGEVSPKVTKEGKGEIDPSTIAKAVTSSKGELPAKMEASASKELPPVPVPSDTGKGNEAVTRQIQNQGREQAIQKYDQTAKSMPQSFTGNTASNAQTFSAPVTQGASRRSLEAYDGTAPTSRKGNPGKEETNETYAGLDAMATGNKTTSSTNSTTNTRTETVSPEKATVPELMQHVDTLVRQGGGKMTVSLNPPDLGRVEVQVVSRGKKIEIEMKSDSEKTKSLLQTHVSSLKDSLQNHDLVLTKVEFHVGKEPQNQNQPSDGKFASFFGGNQNSGQSREFSGRDGASSQSRQSQVAVPQMNTRNRTVSVAAPRPVAARGGVDLRI